jgi:hypothetical protein
VQKKCGNIPLAEQPHAVNVACMAVPGPAEHSALALGEAAAHSVLPQAADSCVTVDGAAGFQIQAATASPTVSESWVGIMPARTWLPPHSPSQT